MGKRKFAIYQRKLLSLNKMAKAFLFTKFIHMQDVLAISVALDHRFNLPLHFGSFGACFGNWLFICFKLRI